MLDSDHIPYDDPDLRVAFRLGWEAGREGKERPIGLIIHAGEYGEAWLKGYQAAQEKAVQEKEVE